MKPVGGSHRVLALWPSGHRPICTHDDSKVTTGMPALGSWELDGRVHRCNMLGAPTHTRTIFFYCSGSVRATRASPAGPVTLFVRRRRRLRAHAEVRCHLRLALSLLPQMRPPGDEGAVLCRDLDRAARVWRRHCRRPRPIPQAAPAPEPRARGIERDHAGTALAPRADHPPPMCAKAARPVDARDLHGARMFADHDAHGAQHGELGGQEPGSYLR